MKKRRMEITLILMMLLIGILVQNKSPSQAGEYEPCILISNPEGKSSIESITSVKGIADYVDHEPIKILNNSAFGSEGYDFNGNGTYDDPYLIEGYNITDSTTHLIHIENTTKYFRIRNNLLNCLDGLNGIALSNVTNGMIENNTIYNCLASIWMNKSSAICFTNNTIHDCFGYGIVVWNSNDSTILSNTVYDCFAICIMLHESSFNNTVSGNTIYESQYDGIYFSQCSNNTFSDNTIYNCFNSGIGPVYQCYNNTLSGNTIYNCSNGISLHESNNNNIILGNIIYNCTNGIELVYAKFNTILYNTVYNCSNHGIRLSFGSVNNTFSYNIVYNNTDYGFICGSSDDNNTVDFNNFVSNNAGFPARTSQAFDNGTTNNILYNYWEDWNGTGSYGIDGTANNNDSFPLINPVLPTVTIMTPLAQEYVTNTIKVSFSGTPTILNYWYYIEEVHNENQTWIASVDETLPDNTYTLHAYGRDILNNTVHDSVTFTIDTTPPVIDITSPISTTYSQDSVTLIYTVSDGIVTIYINGVANDTAYPSGYIVSGMPDGSYNLTIIAVDQVGNIGKVTVLGTIDTTPPAITIVSPTAITYSTGIVTVDLSGEDVTVFWYYIASFDDVNQTWLTSVERTLSEGTYTLHSYGNDSAGNIAYTNVTFTIEFITDTTTTTTTTTAITTTEKVSFPPSFLTVLLFLGVIKEFTHRRKKI